MKNVQKMRDNSRRLSRLNVEETILSTVVQHAVTEIEQYNLFADCLMRWNSPKVMK